MQTGLDDRLGRYSSDRLPILVLTPKTPPPPTAFWLPFLPATRAVCFWPLMFSLNRTPRIWLIAGVAAATIVLLLVGFRSQYPGYNPTYYSPPLSPPAQSLDPHDGQLQAPPTETDAESRPAPESPTAHPEALLGDSQSLEDTRNATLGVRNEPLPKYLSFLISVASSF